MQASLEKIVPCKGFPLNTVITQPPLCTPKKQGSSQNKLPTFVFVAGVEGSGHHALKDVWWSLERSGVKIKLIVYDQVFHSLGIENHASYHYSSVRKETYIKNMKPLFEEARKTGATVIDAQNSYPMGKGAGSLAHPDLIMLNELDGELYNLHVLVMFRDPVNATLSAVRRFRNDDEYQYKNSQFQARMVSENLAVINNALPMLPCNRYMVVSYEKLIQEPSSLRAPIAQFLGVPSTVLKEGFKKLTPREPKPDSPSVANDRKELKAFFKDHELLWPLLAGKKWC